MADAALGAAIRHIRTVAAAHGFQGQSDGELLRAFVAGGDRDAFAALVQRHGPLVLSVCRRMLGHHDAEDAFQATFLLLARRAATVRKCASLASWLHGVAYRMAKNAQRAAARRRNHEGRAEAPPSKSPAQEAAWREVQSLLDEEVQRLPAAHREPFVLCCLENHGCAEVARRLGIKEGTVWSRLAAAKKRLRQRLARRGVDLTAVLALAALADTATACVPKTYVTAVVKAAAAGGSAAGAVSATVEALVHGANRAMILNKIKTVALVLLTTGAAGIGLGVTAYLPARAALRATPDHPDAGQPPAAGRPAGLPSDWSKTVEPAAEKDKAGQTATGAKVKLWVEQGWLVVRRETPAGELEWQVVLARADDPRPPQVRVDAAGVIDLTYGSYFVRESLGSLRVLRERKTGQSPAWPRLPPDPRRESLGFGGSGNPTRVAAWKVGDWCWVECGPADDRGDIWLRFQHMEQLGGGHSFTGRVNGPSWFEAGSQRVQDEGDLLIAERTLPGDAARMLAAKKIRQEIGTKPAPALAAKEWFNAPGGLELDKLRGKVVLLDFWGTWCGPCVAKLPRTEELHQKYKDRGVVVIGVHSAHGRENLADFLKEKKVSFPVVVDQGDTAERYAIEAWPTYFLIGKDGKVVLGYSHEPPKESQIEELLR